MGEELWKLLLVIAMNRIRAAEAHHRAIKRDVGVTTGGDLDREPGAERMTRLICNSWSTTHWNAFRKGTASW